MSEKQVTVEAVETNEAVERAKDFWSRFSKPIIYIGTAVIVLVGGWYGYSKFVKQPNEIKAAEMIFPAEHLFDKMAKDGSFSKDSINLVLNGGSGISTGILKIISNYGGTATGNRAHYIAGACYLQSGDFNNAIKHLKDFSTSATQVQSRAYSMLGDANAELKKNDEAFDYYKKAAAVNTKDEFITAEALYRAAGFAEATGKTNDAIEMYKKIRDEYPKSSRAGDVDKYLARLGVLN
ncbi:MAG: tetratricopeptide repeat protein [Bacteroidota bacterium]